MATETTLPPDYIAAQKQRLLDLNATLRGDDQAAATEDATLQDNAVDEVETYEDDAQKINLRDNEAALIQHNAARLAQVKRALEKIEQGTYGLSDRSGKPIPRARLDALPESLWNVDEDEDAEG